MKDKEFIFFLKEMLNATCDILELAGDDPSTKEKKQILKNNALELIKCAIELYQCTGEL